MKKGSVFDALELSRGIVDRKFRRRLIIHAFNNRWMFNVYFVPNYVIILLLFDVGYVVDFPRIRRLKYANEKSVHKKVRFLRRAAN